MDTQRTAELQALLEGIPLPATRSDLIEYAHAQAGASWAAAALAELPEAEFERLDAVAEALTPAPARPDPPMRPPKPESGKPPGGDDYLAASPADTGLVRHDAPRTNPPQSAIEQQTQRQQRQKAEQES
jgi:hypothetical protein